MYVSCILYIMMIVGINTIAITNDSTGIHHCHKILPRTWPCTSTSASIWCSPWPRYLSTSSGTQTKCMIWSTCNWYIMVRFESMFWLIFNKFLIINWDDLDDFMLRSLNLYLHHSKSIFSAGAWYNFWTAKPLWWGDTRLGTLGTTMSVEWILGPGFFMCPLKCS